MTAVFLCKVGNILPDNSVVINCTSSFPYSKQSLSLYCCQLENSIILLWILHYHMRACFSGHMSWICRHPSFSSLHIIYPISSISLYLFPYLAIFHFYFVFSISFLLFTPFLYILSLSQTLSPCAFDLWYIDCTNGLSPWPLFIHTLPSHLVVLCHSASASVIWQKKTTANLKQKRGLKRCLYISTSFLGLLPLPWEYTLLKIYERHVEECFLSSGGHRWTTSP